MTKVTSDLVPQPASPDVVAYVDEAGEMGYSRNFTESRDDAVGLMCSLAYPVDRLDQMREAYRDGFNRFCAAAPEKASIHITDAFRPGNENWAAVAYSVRKEFFELVRSQEVPVIYEARRARLERQAYERNESLREQAMAQRQSRIRLSQHASINRIEEAIAEGLALKLDLFTDCCGLRCVDLYFDEINKDLAKRYGAILEKLRSNSAKTIEMKGWDPDTQRSIRRVAHLKTTMVNAPLGFELDAKHIGQIQVVGKADPLVLAADIVANSLHRHLSGLPVDAKLNAPSSIATWELKDRVWGVGDDAIEDVI